MKSKKGQSTGIAIISAIFILIVFMSSVNFIIDEVTTASINLNCSDASNISDGTKLLCLVVNSTVIYWVWLAVSIAVGLILARFVI